MGNFTVGTAKLDITPGLGCHMCGYFEDRIATGINDPLYVKALAISDGERDSSRRKQASTRSTF